MSKLVIGMALTLTVGVGAGLFGARFLNLDQTGAPAVAEAGADKPLFYRNPMNPAITSPVPAQDEMGMDYIPVYPDKPKAERKPLFYRNPMNPAITSPVAAQDEMGMDYIPVYAEDDSDGASEEPAGTVKIDPVMVQNIGVRTALVETRDLAKIVRATGRVTVDESRVTRLHPRTEGWIQKQFAARVGDPVRKGDELLTLYSPQLVTSQQEYLLALDNLKALENSSYKDIQQGAQQLVESSRERLRLLDVPEHEINNLAASGQVSKAVGIESPFDGVVLNIGAREGQYIMPRTELYVIADLSKVWVLADVYEYELPWIKVGDTAMLQTTGMQGPQLKGKVAYIYPFAKAQTRTVQVRIEIDNRHGLLKPDMFAEVAIGASSRSNATVVPSEAIVRSGEREQVFVVRGEGKFEPREVTLGHSSEGWVEVLTGLKPGERVVNSALFLIDSESKLREATAKMMEAAKQPAGNPSDDNMNSLSMDSLSMDGMSMDSGSEALSMDGMSMDGTSMDGMSMDSTEQTLSMDGMSMDSMSLNPAAKAQTAADSMDMQNMTLSDGSGVKAEPGKGAVAND